MKITNFFTMNKTAGTAGSTNASYPVDKHPQMVFQQTSPTDGIIRRPQDYKNNSPRVTVEVNEPTLKKLGIANDVVREIRGEMGIQPGNQWLGMQPDGRNYFRALHSQLNGGGAGVFAPEAAESVVKSGAGTCGPMTSLTYFKLRQRGMDGPMGQGMSNRHVFGVIGDPREGPVIKADSWTQIPSAHVMSAQEISNTKFALRPGEPVPKSMFAGIERLSDAEIDALTQNQLKHPPGEHHYLQDIIDFDANSIANGGKNFMWNRVYGPENPNTQYTVKGGKTLPQSFDQVPVKLWEDNVRTKQNSIDAYIKQHPGVMEAAGYKPEGSDGQ